MSKTLLQALVAVKLVLVMTVPAAPAWGALRSDEDDQTWVSSIVETFRAFLIATSSALDSDAEEDSTAEEGVDGETESGPEIDPYG